MNHFSNLNSIENVNGPYSITLELNSTTAVFSTSVVSDTVNGVASFLGLRILSGDYFTLTAKAGDMVSAVSTDFYVENFVYTVEVVSDNNSPSLNFTFTLTVTLKGEDNLLFPGTCTVSLSESSSSLQGSILSKDITSGTGTFDVYLKALGSPTIIATCPNTGTAESKTAQITINVQANKLVITHTSPSVT